MATKYRRTETERETPPLRRLTPWDRMGPLVPRLSRRQGIFVTVCFLLSLATIMRMAANRQRPPAPHDRYLRTVGLVDRLWRDEAGQGWVSLKIDTGADAPWQADAPIPDPYWERILAGQRLAVLVDPPVESAGPRLVECGLVALPDPMR